MGIFEPFLTVYFAQLGLSGREISILTVLFPFMMIVAAPALSAMADHHAWRVRILTWSLLGFSLILCVLWIPRTFTSLIPLMVLLSFFRSPAVPIADSLIARMALRYRLNLGNLRLWGSLSFALVTIAFGALWEQIGFTPMFVLAGMTYIPVMLVATLLEEGPKVEPKHRRPLREIGRDWGLVALLFTTFLVGGALGVAFVFGGVYMAYLGGGKLMVGLYFGLGALSELPSMQYSMLLIRRLGGPLTLMLAYGLLGIGYLGHVLAWTPLLLLPAAVIKGAGFGLFIISTIRLLDERVPEDRSTTVQGIMNAGAFGLAPLLSGLLAGEIYDSFSPRAVFIVSIILVGLAGLVLAVAWPRYLTPKPAFH